MFMQIKVKAFLHYDFRTAFGNMDITFVPVARK